jgi:glucose/arabinose dehydrogenase
VLRLNPDGSVPSDNPFAGREGYLPEIYTLGHRSSLGLAVHPGTGALWQSENGPNGGDELNVIRAGLNYGWPLVSLGRAYPGPWHSKVATHEGYEPPIVYWTPAIAVAGIEFRILVNENMEELRREALLVDLRQRIRDVVQGPDDLLYVLTDEDEGAVLRIEPAN